MIYSIVVAHHVNLIFSRNRDSNKNQVFCIMLLRWWKRLLSGHLSSPAPASGFMIFRKFADFPHRWLCPAIGKIISEQPKMGLHITATTCDSTNNVLAGGKTHWDVKILGEANYEHKMTGNPVRSCLNI